MSIFSRFAHRAWCEIKGLTRLERQKQFFENYGIAYTEDHDRAYTTRCREEGLPVHSIQRVFNSGRRDLIDISETASSPLMAVMNLAGMCESDDSIDKHIRASRARLQAYLNIGNDITGTQLVAVIDYQPENTEREVVIGAIEYKIAVA